jgi:hypothetical protein
MESKMVVHRYIDASGESVAAVDPGQLEFIINSPDAGTRLKPDEIATLAAIARRIDCLKRVPTLVVSAPEVAALTRAWIVLNPPAVMKDPLTVYERDHLRKLPYVAGQTFTVWDRGEVDQNGSIRAARAIAMHWFPSAASFGQRYYAKSARDAFFIADELISDPNTARHFVLDIDSCSGDAERPFISAGEAEAAISAITEALRAYFGLDPRPRICCGSRTKPDGRLKTSYHVTYRSIICENVYSCSILAGAARRVVSAAAAAAIDMGIYREHMCLRLPRSSYLEPTSPGTVKGAPKLRGIGGHPLREYLVQLSNEDAATITFDCPRMSRINDDLNPLTGASYTEIETGRQVEMMRGDSEPINPDEEAYRTARGYFPENKFPLHKHGRLADGARFFCFSIPLSALCRVCDRVHARDNCMWCLVTISGFVLQKCFKEPGRRLFLTRIEPLKKSQRETDRYEKCKLKLDSALASREPFDPMKHGFLPERGTDSAFPTFNIYNSGRPHMRDYPRDIGRTFFVGAQYGNGKSEALARHLATLPRETTMCVLTYRITLAGNQTVTFSEMDMHCYLDVKPYEIEDPRVIVSIESIKRVGGRRYDYVILDDGVQVIRQLNAPTVRDKAGVYEAYLEIIRSAGTVIFMDANLCEDLLEHARELRGVAGQRMEINLYKRLAGFDIKILSGTHWLFAKFARRLARGKNIVFASNSRKMCEMAHAIAGAIVGPDACLTLTKDNQNAKKNFIENMSTIVPTLRMLAYSPTVDSGVSIKQVHFHQLFAYMVNLSSDDCNSVQQLFRVRNLSDNVMRIVINQISEEEDLPRPSQVVEIARRSIAHKLALTTRPPEADFGPVSECDAPRVDASMESTTLRTVRARQESKQYYFRNMVHLLAATGANITVSRSSFKRPERAFKEFMKRFKRVKKDNEERVCFEARLFADYARDTGHFHPLHERVSDKIMRLLWPRQMVAATESLILSVIKNEDIIKAWKFVAAHRTCGGEFIASLDRRSMDEIFTLDYIIPDKVSLLRRSLAVLNHAGFRAPNDRSRIDPDERIKALNDFHVARYSESLDNVRRDYGLVGAAKERKIMDFRYTSARDVRMQVSAALTCFGAKLHEGGKMRIRHKVLGKIINLRLHRERARSLTDPREILTIPVYNIDMLSCVKRPWAGWMKMLMEPPPESAMAPTMNASKIAGEPVETFINRNYIAARALSEAGEELPVTFHEVRRNTEVQPDMLERLSATEFVPAKTASKILRENDGALLDATVPAHKEILGALLTRVKFDSEREKGKFAELLSACVVDPLQVAIVAREVAPAVAAVITAPPTPAAAALTAAIIAEAPRVVTNIERNADALADEAAPNYPAEWLRIVESGVARYRIVELVKYLQVLTLATYQDVLNCEWRAARPDDRFSPVFGPVPLERRLTRLKRSKRARLNPKTGTREFAIETRVIPVKIDAALIVLMIVKVREMNLKSLPAFKRDYESHLRINSTNVKAFYESIVLSAIAELNLAPEQAHTAKTIIEGQERAHE